MIQYVHTTNYDTVFLLWAKSINDRERGEIRTVCNFAVRASKAIRWCQIMSDRDLIIFKDDGLRIAFAFTKPRRTHKSEDPYAHNVEN